MTIPLTWSRLKQLVYYNPDTGEFTRILQVAGRCKIGDTAGKVCKDGYKRFEIGGKSYKTARLAWLYMTGSWPKEFVDHVNGVRSDDRFCNLREATRRENAQNQKVHRVREDKWSAQIYLGNKKSKHVGYFGTKEEATQASIELLKNVTSTDKEVI